MGALQEEFGRLGYLLDQLLSLLEEGEDRFWRLYILRGQRQVAKHQLGGATYILGCYGGEGTFSDFELGAAIRESDPLRYRNLNARLGELRTQIFESASRIASRRLW